MNKVTLFFLLSLLTFSFELSSLKSFETANFNDLQDKLFIYITENCSVCKEQVGVLKKCMGTDKVVALLEGKSEEKMRFYVRRKKIPFQTYYLRGQLKESLDLRQSPQLLVIKKDTVQKRLVGLQKDCKKIQKLL